MRTLIMGASALTLALLGAAATFAPQELLSRFSQQSSPAVGLMVQLLGATYLGFAMLNWSAKDSLIGGIYNRPVAIGNLLHFFAGGLALAKGMVSASAAPPGMLALTLVYLGFAVAFTYLMFTSPVQPQD